MNLLLSVIGLALATLRENKVRSFLTLLGVMIGTGTIIGVGSILTGLDGAVTGAIRAGEVGPAARARPESGPAPQPAEPQHDPGLRARALVPTLERPAHEAAYERCRCHLSISFRTGRT